MKKKDKRMRPVDLECPLRNCKATKKDGINYIGEDIILAEILPRLPVKSLLRFKCVSKVWYSFISYNKDFIQSHLKNSSNNKNFTHHDIIIASVDDIDEISSKQCSFPSWIDEPSNFSSAKFTIINNDFSQSKGDFLIVGSCNGLCCVQKGMDDFFLWNPATRKSYKSPVLEIMDPEHYTLAGFGFDEVHDDYKVLAVTFSQRGVVAVRLYKSKTNSWKAVQNNFKPRTYFYGMSAKFLNGKLHWFATSSLGREHDMIYCFDLEREVHGSVAKPNYSNKCLVQSVGVLDGCLSFILNSSWESMEVWVMKHYGMEESWYLLASISYSHNLMRTMDDYEPFCMGQGGRILFSYGDFCGFIIYDPNNKSSTILSWPSTPHFQANVSVQSLVSPVPLGDSTITNYVPGW